MLYINSAINPILYNVMSSKFRDGFRRAFLGCCGAKRGGIGGQYTYTYSGHMGGYHHTVTHTTGTTHHGSLYAANGSASNGSPANGGKPSVRRLNSAGGSVSLVYSSLRRAW